MVPDRPVAPRTRRHQHPKAMQEGAEVHVGLTGEFGAHRVSPRQLLAALQARWSDFGKTIPRSSSKMTIRHLQHQFCPSNQTPTAISIVDRALRLQHNSVFNFHC